MAELTASVAEARANFSRIAAAVSRTGRPVTVFRNSKPWVAIVPVDQNRLPDVDWSAGAVAVDPALGHAVLPASWDDPSDDGLYDDLA